MQDLTLMLFAKPITKGKMTGIWEVNHIIGNQLWVMLSSKGYIKNKWGDVSLNTLTKREKVLMFWGFFDFLYVAWFSLESIKKGRTPYVTDVMSMIEVVGNVGGLFPAFGAFVSFVFQLSIILTAFLLILGHRRAKIFCFIQIPFRLYFIVPSISLILIGAAYFGDYSITLILSLVVASEVFKGLSLWKLG